MTAQPIARAAAPSVAGVPMRVLQRDDRRWQRTRALRAMAAAALSRPSRPWSIGPAASEEELLSAYRLVYEQYVKAGYEPAHDAGLRVTKHHLLPTTRVIVVRDTSSAGRIVGTATLVVDGPLGLPLETLCGKCIEAMRARGQKMGEIISNAVLPEFAGIEVVALLLRAGGQEARRLGLTTLVSTYARHHSAFFQTLLGAVPFGGVAAYDHGHGAIAQCHRTELDAWQPAKPAPEVAVPQAPEVAAPPASFTMDDAFITQLLARHPELAASLSAADRHCITEAMQAHGVAVRSDRGCC